MEVKDFRIYIGNTLSVDVHTSIEILPNRVFLQTECSVSKCLNLAKIAFDGGLKPKRESHNRRGGDLP